MKRVFLLGYPITYSLSPAMHNAAFQAMGLDWRYALLSVTAGDLAGAVARLRWADCAGANVTTPHKEAIIAFLDDLGDMARKTGAVNTVLKRDGKLIGENTDVAGFMQALQDAGISPHDARIVLFGAGGAARAVSFGLAEAGVSGIVILNRSPVRARQLAAMLQGHFPRLSLAINTSDALKDADIIVNATPVGMWPNVAESPMPPGSVCRRGAIAIDLVYYPGETRFLREAARCGAQTLGGLSMLVYQGALAFALWTGYAPPVQVMFQAARRALGEEGGG